MVSWQNLGSSRIVKRDLKRLRWTLIGLRASKLLQVCPLSHTLTGECMKYSM